MSAPDLDHARLLAAERLADARAELTDLRAELAHAPRWRPARGLSARCDEALELIADMRQRMQRKLVVALVGPTGAGKSTLLNALAGVDDLSSSGTSRPTTRQVVVFCKDRDDAGPLLAAVGRDKVHVVTSPAAAALEHVVLVDTPDINSAALAAHRPIVEAVLGQADAMACVFNVENPKSRDNVDFLAPFVAGFPSRFVMAVLNHCDRQDEAELRRDIVPDFERHLRASWDREPAGLYCTSARRHLRRPEWPEGARPRHDFDQFPALRQALFGSLNSASVVLDARIERAKHLVAAVGSAVGERAQASAADLAGAKRRARALRGEALAAAAASLSQQGARLGVGADALLYQRLANAWWGPVGWLIGLWARMLVVGAGFANIMRFGRPLRQLWGVVTSLAKFKESRAAIEEAETGARATVAARRYRDVYERAWPEIAEPLVGAGFDASVRDASAVVPDAAQLDQALASGWTRALDAQLERCTDALSGLWLQVLLNALVLVPAGVVAVQSVVSFVQGVLLSGDYFRHALWTVVLLWLLAFVAFQMLARVVGGRRLLKKTFASLTDALHDSGGAQGDALVDELDAVARLARRR
ncbi:MAG: hypothetical protein CSA66_05635 [Proteobacteria bacterium]|nr:MAG: hypothetical protein CSA66_05635 [Pseudomonadota bacterium]